MYASGTTVHKYDIDNKFIPDPVPEKMHEILKVKPNPFSDELRVRIRIDKKTHAKLDLISADRIHISNIYDGILNYGVHFFEIREKDFYEIKSGLHILLLRTDEGFQTEKVIKADHWKAEKN